MNDFIKVATAVCPVQVGDVAANCQEIQKKILTATQEGVNLLVFPELTLTGYTCGDLFFQAALQETARTELQKLLQATKQASLVYWVGAPLVLQGQLYNCALLVAQGRVLGIVPKTFLPNYNEFYEKRWFASANDCPLKTCPATAIGLAGDYEIPVGNDLVFQINGVNLGAEICEDLWTPLAPSTFLALNGAEIIANLSASNETIGKRQYRTELVKQQAARNLCAYLYCSAGSTESTTDLVFSGHSLIAENGVLLKESTEFLAQDYLLVAELDLGKIRADRQKNQSFKDTVTCYGQQNSARQIRITTPNLSFFSDGQTVPVKKLPFVPSSVTARQERCQQIFALQVAGLQKRLHLTKGKLVVGVSGGLDSTLALLVSVAAMEQEGRPRSEVVGITMPGFGTTGQTYQQAQNLMRTLGVTMVEIDIKEACLQHFQAIGQTVEKQDVTYENVQARERTQILMDYASRVSGFVVGTGDLSELALGWCTYNADHMSMYGVNASIPKTLVRWLILSLAQTERFANSAAVLNAIAQTPISPELLPPDAQGQIIQQTESLIGPYALHDFFLYYLLRYGFAPTKIFQLACRAFATDFTSVVILKWLRVFYQRFFSQQYKRSCLPDGVKIGSVCLSPRGDWRMPSDASVALWLQEIDHLVVELEA